ncbi:MAG: hypothetical protein H6827_09625 [Planctomycetes bacterium]|nr:hypothetical protein [Planctomycetota bacterium]
MAELLKGIMGVCREMGLNFEQAEHIANTDAKAMGEWVPSPFLEDDSEVPQERRDSFFDPGLSSSDVETAVDSPEVDPDEETRVLVVPAPPPFPSASLVRDPVAELLGRVQLLVRRFGDRIAIEDPELVANLKRSLDAFGRGMEDVSTA